MTRRPWDDDPEVEVPESDPIRSAPLDRTYLPDIDPRHVVIDWISGSWPVPGDDWICGQVMEVWKDGSRLVKRRINPAMREHPSWSSKVQVRVVGGICHVSGNLNKWLHGHALHGHTDPGELLTEWCRFQSRDLGRSIVPASPFDVQLTRLDLTAHHDAGTVERADHLLAALRYVLRARLPGETMPGEVKEYRNTVYWGQHSRAWTLKVYNKYRELRRHWAGGNHTLENWEVPESVLRWELTLRAPELLRHWANLHPVPSANFNLHGWSKWAWSKTLKCAGNWNEQKVLAMFTKYLTNRIQAFDNSTLPPDGMSGKDLMIFRSWQHQDPLETVYGRSQWFEVRKRFKEKYQIDLQRPPNVEFRENVVSQTLDDLRKGRLYAFRPKPQTQQIEAA